MSNVTNLDDHRPHITGQAICRDCQHTWQAVAPVDTFDLECPACHKMNGYIDLNLDDDGHYDDMSD
jgi:Zn finger protein HypA/HybF involved in hydrogenase expression